MSKRDEALGCGLRRARAAASLSTRPSPSAHLLGDRVDAVRRGDQRRAVRRDEAALHGAAGFHQLRGEHHVDVARQRHQRQHRRAAVRARPARADTARRSRWSRRCAAPRRAPRWSGRCSRCASPRSTIQSASTPPPSPPMARIAILIGWARGHRIVSERIGVRARRASPPLQPADHARRARARRSGPSALGLLTICAL